MIRADLLPRWIHLTWGTPWLCVYEHCVNCTPIFAQGSCFEVLLYNFNKVCLKNTPISYWCLGLKESHCLKADIQEGLL